jgi:hypothetical protein
MNAKKVLTGSAPQAPGTPELGQALAEAGLEFWQAPEGFWAIRVKAAAVPTVKASRRRRPRRAA